VGVTSLLENFILGAICIIFLEVVWGVLSNDVLAYFVRLPLPALGLPCVDEVGGIDAFRCYTNSQQVHLVKSNATGMKLDDVHVVTTGFCECVVAARPYLEYSVDRVFYLFSIGLFAWFVYNWLDAWLAPHRGTMRALKTLQRMQQGGGRGHPAALSAADESEHVDELAERDQPLGPTPAEAAFCSPARQRRASGVGR